MLRSLRRRWRALSAPTLFVISFAVLIALGTAGLMLLPTFHAGRPLDFVDALFTMTSAVCVTGLVVVDTATHFTFLGQLWVLLFVQIGGLGLITVATLLIGFVGRRLSLRSEMVAVATTHESHGRELARVVRGVVWYTLGLETAGAVLLWLLWRRTMGDADAAWHAVFQAVSAFCNAGFSTFSDSLVGFADRPAVLTVVSVLIVLGGFGYLSSAELVRWWRPPAAVRPPRLSAHTYAAAVVTLGLLLGGTVCFAVFEWRGALAPLGVSAKLANAWFMSVTPRTAGFNTVDYAQLGNVTGYLTVLLMFVGGSPGSAAGGVKTTALAILGVLALARVRGRRYVELNHRAVPETTVQRAVSLTLVAFVLVTACVAVLSFTETHGTPVPQAREAFLPLMFEAVSAFGTVGLSMGVTANLTTAGKLVIILLMFVGRVGPLSFFAAIALRSAGRPAEFRPAHEDVVVG
jgi:trk system potassium uptake protein TrkH